MAQPTGPTVRYTVILIFLFPFAALALSWILSDRERERERSEFLIQNMMTMMSLCVQCVLDLVVAGFSLMIGLGIFAFIASILCSAAFFYNAKEVF